MALDRFVYWNKRRPSEEDLEKIILKFFGAGGVVQRKTKTDAWGHVSNKIWWLVSLSGKPSHPFNDLVEHDLNASLNAERWIEICATDLESNIDIITRSQDHFTNALAEHLAKGIALFYEATFDDGTQDESQDSR